MNLSGKVKGSSLVVPVDAGEHGKFYQYFKIIQETGQVENEKEFRLCNTASEFDEWTASRAAVYTEKRPYKVEQVEA